MPWAFKNSAKASFLFKFPTTSVDIDWDDLLSDCNIARSNASSSSLSFAFSVVVVVDFGSVNKFYL